MKYFKKEEPKNLRTWFDGQPVDENGNKINCDFRSCLPGDVKREILDFFLQEQGYLCCYTGLIIDNDTSHIEHLKPYTLCKVEGKNEDVYYLNLVAAYPGAFYEEEIAGAKVKKCPFGAHAKDQWYEVDKFVSPLDEDCESRFVFDQFGGVKAVDDDNAAQTTIERLVLDHDQLNVLREEAINEVLFPEDFELDETEFQLIAEGNYSVKDENRRLPKFCFVIEQVARQLIYAA
jgi:uncharacterized protein (TIGR02646 family)